MAVTEVWAAMLPLAAGTFAIRILGVAIGQRIPAEGVWAAGLRALPGCLIVALVAMSVLSGGPAEWIAASVAALVAVATRNLLITMAAGIAAVALLRHVPW